MTDRKRYQPRLSLKPLRFIRWREHGKRYGEMTKWWRLYLFGLIPVGRIPRRDRQ